MKQIFYYLVSFIILITGLAAIYRLYFKADLPFEYHAADHKIISDSVYKDILYGDYIYRIDNFPVNSESDVEFVLDSKHIDEEVNLSTGRENNISGNTTVRLSNYYNDNFFILISLIIGLSYWLTGVYVFTFGKKEKGAKILSLTLIILSLAILTSACYYARGDDYIGYFIRIFHSVSYVLASVFFIHFTLIFPNSFSAKQKPVIKSLYIIASAFSIWMGYSLYIAMQFLDVNSFRTFQIQWTIAQLILLISVISGTLILIVKYKRFSTKKEKTKLEWLFWGQASGVSPFIIFWLIPSIFGLPYLIKEEIILSFLILIPVSFAIAVVKYQLFDIEVVIKRSIIYSLLIVLMVLFYFGIIYGLSFFTSKFIGNDSKLFNIIAAVIIALAFNPVRVKLKNYVDSVFYRQKYSFDKAIKDLSSKIVKCETAGILGEVLIKEINLFIPVKCIALCILSADGERLRVLSQKNFDEMLKNIPALKVKKIFSRFDLPFAVREKIEKHIGFDPSLENVFKRWNISLGIPLTLESTDVGVILLGDKLSGLKYTSADLELLKTISLSASLALKRLQLREQLIIEEIENTNLKEINELKSYFVATVSHDLKTPLSSIKLFSDLLRSENISKEKKQEFLGVIEGETDRLGRMINNILNYAKIERGIKNYSFPKVDLNKVVNKIMENMNYELMMNKFVVEKHISDEELFINGDPDALNSLLENLLSNAIKYSFDNKFLRVTTFADSTDSVICVEDNGIGISEENLENIFNPFYREKGTAHSKIKGTGLGLSIVKNIVDAHSGKIEVRSEVGRGSIFKISLPIIKNEN